MLIFFSRQNGILIINVSYFFQMPYVYVGHPSLYHGKKLFNILCNLKKFGQGRVVYRTTEQAHSEPSFYRILLAQPEMDAKLDLGRVVAERVYRGKRRTEPFNLTEEAQFPDFCLVPKELESEFCRNDEIQDFVKERDAMAKPKRIEMPPLMKLFVERNRLQHNEEVNESDLVLNAHEIYEGEHRLEDRIESNSMEKYITDRFADFEDFDVKRVPTDWNFQRQSRHVGFKAYLKRQEGTRDYKDWLARQEESNS